METKRIFDLLELYKSDFKSKEIVFAEKKNNTWTYVSANQYVEEVEAFCYGLLELGLKPTDIVVTIFSNTPSWNIVDMALLKCGLLQVPIYPNISEVELTYILNHSEPAICITDNNDSFVKLSKTLNRLEKSIKIYSFDKNNSDNQARKLFIYQPTTNIANKLSQIQESITEDDVATIIYTSGTTGNPKGVMLTHKNIVSNFTAVAPISGFNRTHRALSILPLCHIYERMINYMYQYLGMSIYYADSFEKTAQYLKEVKPHCICVVPRVLEKTVDRIKAKIRTLPKWKKIIARYAFNVAVNYSFNHDRNLLFKLQHQFLSKAVYKYWRQGLGSKLRVVVSGGAFLQEGLVRLFWCMGIKLLEGYGLTETSPVIAVAKPDKENCKFGTIGPLLEGVQIKIADDGEILVKGANVMKSYYKDELATQSSFTKDYWFKTGDYGKMIENKFLKVTGRKTEKFKTSNGKFVSPQQIENILIESPFIENVMIVGQNKNYISAIIVPDFTFLKEWCRIKQLKIKNLNKMLKNKQVIQRIYEEVEKYNQRLNSHEQIRKITLLPETWTVDRGELTPTLKVKRDFILKKYSKQIKEMYD